MTHRLTGAVNLSCRFSPRLAEFTVEPSLGKRARLYGVPAHVSESTAPENTTSNQFTGLSDMLIGSSNLVVKLSCLTRTCDGRFKYSDGDQGCRYRCQFDSSTASPVTRHDVSVHMALCCRV